MMTTARLATFAKNNGDRTWQLSFENGEPMNKMENQTCRREPPDASKTKIARKGTAVGTSAGAGTSYFR